MDRCAVLVDAGYLLGAAGTLVCGDTDRSKISVDYTALITSWIDEAQRQTGLPILRVLWYDGARESQLTPEHRRIRGHPNVKVRLGDVVQRGGRWINLHRTTRDLSAIRQWARDHGYRVSDRGRVAGEILARYDETH